MELRVFVEPQQGASYDQQAAMAAAAEELGYGGFFRSDHLMAFLTPGRDGLPGPTDSWVTLGAIARETSRLRLGTLVTSATFRSPGLLALQVAQVDVMSGGRVELGLGAGWNDEEHRAHAVPFPSLGERFDRLEEQLEIITGMWSTPVGSRFDHAGRHYTVERSPGLPKPAQSPHPPVIVGGHGASRTPRLAARFADELNVPFGDVDVTAAQYQRTRDACAEHGRDPGELVYSFATTVCCGRDEGEISRRAAAIGRKPEELRSNAAAGTPQEVADTLGRYGEIGASRAYLQVLDMDDLDHVRLIAEEVMPSLAT